MKHQREREQRGQLIKEVQRHQIGGQRRTEHHALGQKEKRIETGLFSLVLHIHIGVQNGQQPACRRQQTEEGGQRIHHQGKRQRFSEIDRRCGRCASFADRKENHTGNHGLRQQHKGGLLFAAAGRKESADQTQQSGKENHSVQYHIVWLSFPINIGRTERSPAAAAPSAARNGYRSQARWPAAPWQAPM